MQMGMGRRGWLRELTFSFAFLVLVVMIGLKKEIY